MFVTKEGKSIIGNKNQSLERVLYTPGKKNQCRQGKGSESGTIQQNSIKKKGQGGGSRNRAGKGGKGQTLDQEPLRLL